MRPEWKTCLELLDQHVVPAIGCTEPIAVAFAAAKAAEVLTLEPETILVRVSGNLLKNGMGVGVPGTGKRGLDIAAAVGAIGGKSEAGLEVLKVLTEAQAEKGKMLLASGKVRLDLADTDALLHCDVTVTHAEESARVVIEDDHTRIVAIERNGAALFDAEAANDTSPDAPWPLSVDLIFEFATKAPLEAIRFIEESARMNLAIAKEGLAGDYGLQVGKSIEENIRLEVMCDNLTSHATKLTSAAADARMHGIHMPVMTNSGSGNQGLTCTLPVVAAAEKLKADEETVIRALILSHLMSIHIKHHLGRLSALCGATVASTAAACGIVHLMGGGRAEIERTIHNMIGNVAGMICDGAKNGCALKIASTVTAGIQSAMLAMQGRTIRGCEGIVAGDIEASIANLARLGTIGMEETDRTILDIMVRKANASGISPQPE